MYPLAPDALITTDGFLPWSDVVGAPFGMPFVAWEPPCGIIDTPFTGVSLASCARVEAPAEVGGVEVAVFVAFAYDLTGSCAGTAPDSCDVVPLAVGALLALSGFGTVEGVTLVMGRFGDEVRRFACREVRAFSSLSSLKFWRLQMSNLKGGITIISAVERR